MACTLIGALHPCTGSVHRIRVPPPESRSTQRTARRSMQNRALSRPAHHTFRPTSRRAPAPCRPTSTKITVFVPPGDAIAPAASCTAGAMVRPDSVLRLGSPTQFSGIASEISSMASLGTMSAGTVTFGRADFGEEEKVNFAVVAFALDVDHDDLARRAARRTGSSRTARPRSRAGSCGAAAGHRAPGRSPARRAAALAAGRELDAHVLVLAAARRAWRSSGRRSGRSRPRSAGGRRRCRRCG